MTKPGNVFASRRGLFLGAAALAMGASRGLANEILLDIASMRPGEFTWHPDRQPAGPVAIVVSIDQQRVHVYRNGIRIAVSTCSTGKPGHDTPTGVFVILEKDRNHKSSTYSNAPMPNMNRLTWDGVALHAGALPGYPASHGCVRLPMAFSEKLFSITHVGTPVIIASGHSDPVTLTQSGPILSGYAHSEMAAAIATAEDRLHPKDWVETESNQFTTVIVSSYDRRAIVLENDQMIDEGTATFADTASVGQHVFVLQSADQTRGFVWQAISHHYLSARVASTDNNILNNIHFDRAFARRTAKRMHSGMIMIVTETPISTDSRSGDDFVILDALDS